MKAPPNVTKGTLTHRGGASFSQVSFMYNPSTVEVTGGANWVKHQIPFIHHPRLQYAGGNGRQVSFDLHLLADDPLAGKVTDIDKMIDTWESLTYPDAGAETLANREPARMTLALGENGIAMNCVLSDITVSYRLSRADGSTRYAVLSVRFEEDAVRAKSMTDRRNRK